MDKLKRGEKIEDYYLRDGWLSSKKIIERDRVCVPEALVTDVLQEYHTQAHPSIAKLLALFSVRYEVIIRMDELRRRATAGVVTCRVCQAVKPWNGGRGKSADFFPIPSDIFQSLCIDEETQLK